jgi:hypothetical protein
MAFGMVRCGVCNKPIYHNPLKPPPAQASSCPRCMNWVRDYVIKLHKLRPEALRL